MFCCNGGAASLFVGSIGDSGVVVEIVVGVTCLPPKKLIILIHEGVKEDRKEGLHLGLFLALASRLGMEGHEVDVTDRCEARQYIVIVLNDMPVISIGREGYYLSS